MNFCFINMPIEFYSPVSGGAISTIISEVSRELSAAGHHVTVLTRLDENAAHPNGEVVPLIFPSPDKMGLVRRKISGLRRRTLGWDWPGYDAYLGAVKTTIKRLASFDAVVVFNDLVIQKYLRPLMPEAVIFGWLQNEWRTRQNNLQPTLAATDKFLTCSQYIADWTASVHGIPASELEVVHSGVNLQQFKPLESRPSGGPLRVLFVGRLDPNKGPDIAADAVAALQSEGLNIEFTVAGAAWFYGSGNDDPYVASLKQKLASINAKYLGHVTRDRIADVYRQADVVCVLSRSNEPFGLVVLEAMASGCAVIASNRGGLPEACGGAGTLVNPDILDQVIANLRLLATNRDTLDRLQISSVERCVSASWAKVAERAVRVTRSSRSSRQNQSVPSSPFACRKH